MACGAANEPVDHVTRLLHDYQHSRQMSLTVESPGNLWVSVAFFGRLTVEAPSR